MPNSTTTYAGDGTTSTFAVGFEYLLQSHVQVELNTRVLLSTEWAWASSTTIQFITTAGAPNPPGDGDAIVIRRVTEIDDRLVDFTNGAVLTEADLDLAAKQNFFLAQEVTERLDDYLAGGLSRIATANGITDVDSDGILGDIVSAILNDATALEIQQRITDIDTNASEILVNLGYITTLQAQTLSITSQLNALAGSISAAVLVQPTEPVPGVGDAPDPIIDSTRWYDSDDNNHPYIWLPTGLVNATYQWTATANPSEYYVELAGGGDPGLTEPQQVREDSTTYLTAGTPALAAGEWAWGDGGGGFNTIIVRLTDSADPDSKSADFLQAYDFLDLLDPRIGQNASDITALDVRLTSAESTVGGHTTSIGANASAISVLDATVTSHAGLISANAGDVTTLNSSLAITDGNVSTNTSNIGTNTADIAAAQADITANASAISSLQTSVSTNGTNITANASDITALESTVNNPTTGVSANAAAVTTLQSRVSITESDIAGAEADIVINATAITALGVDLTAAEGSIVANASAITALDTRVTSAEGSITSHASSIASISATVNGHTSSITTLSSVTATHTTDITAAEGAITTLEAKYGVTLNVGGYITGFAQNNDGSTGTFDILTDKFRVVDPASGGQNPKFVFAIEGGNVLAQNMYLDTLTLGASGAIKIGKANSAATTNGLWLGTDGGSAYDFHIGDATNYLWWDGSEGTLSVNGEVRGTVLFDGGFVALDDAGAVIGLDNTDYVSTADNAWHTQRTFNVKGSGTIAIRIETSNNYTCDISAAGLRIQKNGITQGSEVNITTASTVEHAWSSLTVTDEDDVFTIQSKSGLATSGPGAYGVLDVNWISVRAVNEHVTWS